jgi:hypothetical protein
MRRARIGSLVDFADSMPVASLEDAIMSICRRIEAQRASGHARRARFRNYVILGAMVTRLLFTVQGISPSRDAWL